MATKMLFNIHNPASMLHWIAHNMPHSHPMTATDEWKAIDQWRKDQDNQMYREAVERFPTISTNDPSTRMHAEVVADLTNILCYYRDFIAPLLEHD